MRTVIGPPAFLDVGLLLALVVLTAVAQPYLLATDTLVSVDTASQYYPWYAFLGQSLRAGSIPGWNPATFSGAPFAADPLSGWTYLPAMVVFGLLPLASAVKTYLAFHVLLAAWSTYAFARSLGLGRVGAFTAGLAYANTGFVQIQNTCCSPVASIYAWLPLTLLGAERALRTPHLRARLAWWGLAGVGVSQSAAVWPGQGAYYAALMVGGYIAFRTLAAPPVERSTAGSPTDRTTAVTGSRIGVLVRGAQPRVGRLIAHEASVFTLGAVLAAAGLLPRFEFNALSNLAGGYMGDNLQVGGLQPAQWLFLATPGEWYVGLSVLALAMAAPFVACRQVGPVWYFGVTSVAALALTSTVETPLHWLLYHLLPGFANLHPHAPERILTVAYLGPALLAGTAVCSMRKAKWFRHAALTIGLIAILTADLAFGGIVARAERLLTNPLDGIERLTPVNLATYYQPTPPGTFLAQQLRDSPARFLGYAPHVDGQELAYTFRFADPSTAALLVNNHALPLGLQDVQGYDASHLRRYDAYLTALNGQTQNYHDAVVFAAGLSSPLLDLLNARYIAVPVHVDELDAAALERFPQTVYADSSVRILENPHAFPRAWIVHAAVQVAPGGAASLAAIADGSVDARRTALLEEPPPVLVLPADSTQDQARLTTDEPNRLDVRTTTAAAGLLMVSEIYYPAWQAYVDGQQVPLYVADGALRAVAVPSGEHTVELRFESETLRTGLLISSAAAGLLVLLWLRCLVGLRLPRLARSLSRSLPRR